LKGGWGFYWWMESNGGDEYPAARGRMPDVEADTRFQSFAHMPRCIPYFRGAGTAASATVRSGRPADGFPAHEIAKLRNSVHIGR